MREPTGTSLAHYTTLRVGGPATRLREVDDSEQLCALVAECDQRGEPILLLGGGSNVVISDAGFAGTAIKVRTTGITIEAHDQGCRATVAAGHWWDDVVAQLVAEGYAGVEALSGIPGSTGATPIQNVGAYGQEVAQTITAVQVWDRHVCQRLELAAVDCGFRYRHSIFKANPRYVVLAVSFALRDGGKSMPVRYPELARTLGVEVGQSAPVGEVREAVLALRRGKGMVLDDSDHDTWSAGSFFTNPIVEEQVLAQLPAEAPRFPAEDGKWKTSAAWLIEHAGFTKGYRSPSTTTVSLSTKHTLALTNRGGASAADILVLAREIRDGVAAKFGIQLFPEPVLIGEQW